MGQARTRVCTSEFTLLCAYYIKHGRWCGVGVGGGGGGQGARWGKEL